MQSLMYTYGFGSGQLFLGSEKDAPRIRSCDPSVWPDNTIGAVTAIVPDQPHHYLVSIVVNDNHICAIHDVNGIWEYEFSGDMMFQGDLTLLKAQISAMAHEALREKKLYDPIDFAGTVPLGV